MWPRSFRTCARTRTSLDVYGETLSEDCKNLIQETLSQVTLTFTSNEVSTETATAIAAAGCRTAQATVTGTTALGNVAFRFHLFKDFCYNGSAVTSTYYYTSISDVDPFFYYEGATEVFNGYLVNGLHNTRVQGTFRNCIWTGCFGTFYPLAYVTAAPSGNYDAGGYV